MHVTTEPAILYFGTPVVLIRTVNEDGSYNLAPMSSAFWLGWRCVLGLSGTSQTTRNLLRVGACVLNLPSERQVAAVDRLARTTGANPVPEVKRPRGYRYERNKFEIAGLTPIASETVGAPRVAQCPVQMEAVLEHHRSLAENDQKLAGRVLVLEVRVQRLPVQQSILLAGARERIDPKKWRPVFMRFQ